MKDPFAELKKDPKKMMIAIIIASLAILAAYLHLLLIPQIKGVSATMGKVNSLRAEVKRAEADIAKIDEMRTNIASYDQKVGRYETVLPTEEGIPTLLEDLAAMARKSNMRIVGIVPVVQKEGKAYQGQTYREIPILVTAKSGYHELGRFMSALENSDRFMKVADISIKASPTNINKHDVELLVVTYILLEGR